MILPKEYDYLVVHDELEEALTALTTTNNNLCIIGGGGSGKTEFIKLCCDKRIYPHNTIICTPTGVSAVNASTEGVKATTIHSLFRFPPMSIIPVEQLTTHRNLFSLFVNLHTLIIDEVSMVNADLLSKVVYLLDEYRKNKPCRLILVGDPSQLSPIIATKAEQDYIEDTYSSAFFFHSDIFSSMHIIHFTRIFRQSNKEFSDVLGRFRLHNFTEKDRAYINARVLEVDEFKKEGDFLYVALTNRTVDAINIREIEINKNPAKTYIGVNTYFPVKEVPVPELLTLKKDTQVMICANNHQSGYYNGLLGRIISMENNSIWVHTSHGDFEIKENTWKKYKYEYDPMQKKISANTAGSFQQFPLKIAYALTSHKVQGLSLDRIYVDLEKGCFSSGMLYTILSRVRTLEGLGLARAVQKKDSRLSMDVKKFYRRML